MTKIYRFVFDVLCIMAIIVLPYFALNKIGIVDYVIKNEK